MSETQSLGASIGSAISFSELATRIAGKIAVGYPLRETALLIGSVSAGALTGGNDASTIEGSFFETTAGIQKLFPTTGNRTALQLAIEAGIRNESRQRTSVRFGNAQSDNTALLARVTPGFVIKTNPTENDFDGFALSLPLTVLKQPKGSVTDQDISAQSKLSFEGGPQVSFQLVW